MAKAALTAAAVENAQFTTSGALTDLVDRKVVIVLRDNRKIGGLLRSYDQYANLVLQNAVVRYFYNQYYADVNQGSIYLVRGENVVLIGEVDLDLEDEPIPGMQQLTRPEDISGLIRQVKQEEEQQKNGRAFKEQVLKDLRGFSAEHTEGVS